MCQDKDEYILRAENIKKWFPVERKGFFDKRQYVKAVDDVTLNVKKGETLGIVGESGCGKSTFARTILRLIEPTEGKIIFEGKDITKINDSELREMRKNFQIMFQDPYASLNPRMTVGDIIAEPLDIQKAFKNKKGRLIKIVNLMETCGLDKAFINRYPHEFSGGQRQRIGIARALALNPKLIVCDEPVSALDVSIQSQIINLLIGLQNKYNLTLIFISHDLSVVNHISDRVAVMYLGKVVELANKSDLYNNPKHPYTKALLEAIPKIGGKKFDNNGKFLEGDIPSPISPPPGCTFHTRCPIASEECKKIIPNLEEVSNKHFVSCIKIKNN